MSFPYGKSSDVVLVGDWDGDGVDTLGVRRGSVNMLNNKLKGGAAEVNFTFGAASDQVLVGNWDGK